MGKEVVVLGGGVGGLSAAIYARLAGHHVCLVEGGASVGGKAAELIVGGYRLDPGPSIIILTRIYESLFRDAGREMDAYLRFRKLEAISRVFFEGRDPLDLPAGRTDCEQLVERIAPGDASNFRQLMAQLDRVCPLVDATVFAHPIDRIGRMLDPNFLRIGLGLDVRRTYKQLVDRMFESPLLRAFFYGFPSYGGQTFDSRAPGALLIPYLMIQEGVFYPEGGVGAIPKALERLAVELGVNIRTNSKVVGMVADGTTVKSANLSDGASVSAEVFVSGIDRLTTRSWLGHRSNSRPSFSYFTLHWGIRRKLDGLQHHNLLVPHGFEDGFDTLYRQRRFPIPPIVYLNEVAALDPRSAPEGCSNLFAVVTSPAIEPHIDWAGEAPTAREAVLKTMADFGFSIDPDEVDFERVQTPLYFAEQHGNFRGSLYGPDEKDRLYGMFPLRNRDEHYQNLLYCGGSVQPGAGLPMVVLSGKFAAALI